MAAQHAAQDTHTTGLAEASASQPFSNLPLFACAGHEAPVPSTAQAESWADAVLHYWQCGLADAAIDPSKPLYLLDLAPGHGQLAWLMLGILQQRLAASGLALQPCYLVCGRQQEELAELASHPWLEQYAAPGWFDAAHYDDAIGTLQLLRQERTLQHAENPLVILGQGYFQALPAELVAVHQGRVMEGRVTMRADVNVPASSDKSVRLPDCTLDYDWRTVPAADMAVPMQALLKQYLARFTSTALLLPSAACAMLDKLADIAGRRYLLLSSDYGAHSEQQLRLGALAPPATWSADHVSPPVNYHAISLHQQMQGARTWNHQLRDGGIVLHAAWRDDDCPMLDARFDALVGCLEHAHLDDDGQLAGLTGDPAMPHSAATVMTLLRLSHYDPQVLKAGLPTLLEQAGDLTGNTRSQWQSALMRAWANKLPTPEEDLFYYDAGMLAAQLGHFGLAKESLRLDLSLYGDAATGLYRLACCEATTGNAAEAMALAERALALEPGHPHCLALRNALADKLLRWQHCGWYDAGAACDEDLTLEPLGIEHAESFLYQYRDTQIGVMTRLPELQTVEQARAWIEEQEPGRLSYAVMHECWGFIGVVSMHCAQEAGYFYFWIGSDFQDRGLGRQAVQLLFRQTQRFGVRQVFTSAYQENVRSRNALDYLGFAALPLRAQTPDEDLVFFYRPMQEEGRLEAPAERIRALCADIRSPIVFAANESDYGGDM